MIKRLALGAIVAVVAGCATGPSLDVRMGALMGITEGQMVQRYGYPQRAGIGPDGARNLVYVYMRSAQMGGFAYQQPVTSTTIGTISGVNANQNRNFTANTTTFETVTTPVQTFNYSCVLTFWVNDQGRLYSWNARGNDCR